MSRITIDDLVLTTNLDRVAMRSIARPYEAATTSPV
jgi:hypothetical protein